MLQLQALLLILLLLVINCSITIVAFAANSVVAVDVSSVPHRGLLLQLLPLDVAEVFSTAAAAFAAVAIARQMNAPSTDSLISTNLQAYINQQ